MCCRGVGEEVAVLFGRTGQLFGVWGQVAVCVPELSKGCVVGDWGVLLRCRCVFLSYVCIRLLPYTVQIFV